MDFAAFLLLNAVLYIRPMDFVPGVEGIYTATFCICFVVSLPALLAPGVLRSIFVHPVTVCVIGVVATAILSNLLRGQLEEAYDTANFCMITFLYYILLVCLVRTPARMKYLLASLVIDTCIIAGLGVDDYRGIVHIPNLAVVTEFQYVDGEEVPYRRLSGTQSGLFGDPNDLALLIAGCIIYSLYLLGDRSAGPPLRALWLLTLPLLFQAMSLTYSRGGAMTLMVGLGIYAWLRFGRRAALLALLALPVLLRGGGRQVNFDLSGGTGQARVAIWDLYMSMFLENPVLGVGFAQGMNYATQVAHNSYIHVFGERGFFGGMCFLSAVLLAVWSVVRLKPPRDRPPSDELVRLRTFVLASVGSYAVGIMTLSRADVYPTYTILGLAVAYERIAAGDSPRGPLRLGLKSICVLAATSVAYLLVMYAFIKFNVNYF